MIDRRVLAHLLVGLFLLAMFYWAIAPPGWEKQFKATGEALTKARSFHITILTKDPKGETFEVMKEANCPSDFHVLQRHYAKDGTMIPMEDVEIWSIGKTHVLRQDTSVMDTNDRFGGADCGSKHLLELGMLPNFETILARGNGKRGSKKTIDGKTCREWSIQMPEGNGWGEIYSMCVDENNLPLEVVTRNHVTVAHATHWNEKIELPQPPEVPQRAEAPATSMSQEP